jgi:RNA polymerase sigma-70 factor (ECF subfamily)
MQMLSGAKRNNNLVMFIYENYRNVMYRVAKSIVIDKHLAEDVVQEAFERIIKKMNLIENVNPDALLSYVTLITKSVACNLITKQNKYVTTSLEDSYLDYEDPSALNIEDLAIQKDLVNKISDSLDEIGINYAAPLILRYYFGFSDKETADLLAINSPSTVRSLCFRARRLLLDKISLGGNGNE